MKKAIILIFVFLLIPLNVMAQEIVVTSSYQPVADLKNMTGVNDSILNRLMLHNSSALLDIGNKRIREGFETLCDFRGQSDVPLSWTQFTGGGAGSTIGIDTTGRLPGGKNSIKIHDQTDDGSRAGIICPGGGISTLDYIVNFIYEEDYSNHQGWDSSQGIVTADSLDCATTSNLFILTSSNTNFFIHAGEGGFCYDDNYNIVRASTTTSSSYNNTILAYLNSSGYQFLSNESDATTKTTDITLSGNTNVELRTDGKANQGQDNFYNYIWVINTTPSRNATANRFLWKFNTSVAQTGLNIAWLGDIGANFNTTLSCNNGSSWVNGTANTNGTSITCSISQSSQDFIIGIYLANETVWVNTPLIRQAVADTTPPSITYYNLTDGSGCENWKTDKNNACNTSLVTPVVQFNTSEPAWCAIAGSSSSTLLDKNYTDMGSSRNCTGAVSGEGTQEHFCTLTSQDELVYDTSYLFISCKDASNNQNKTSTSGALRLNITGLEAAGRNSIGLGIQNALLSGYSNYTDLQIYARNQSNNQARGTFDRVAKKGSRIWAFNRIGVSDSHANLINLTPALYTLEFANKTSEYITNQTERTINATK